MKSLIELSKVKSETMLRGDVPMFDMVNVKFEEDGRVYMYNIHRSEREDVYHSISCTSYENESLSIFVNSCTSKRMTKLYTDSAKFEAAIKRIQSKMS